MSTSTGSQLEPARGLPAKLVVVVCIVTVTEALAGNVIWPFLPSAVQRWGATEEQTGIYVGLLASAFFLAQVLFVVHWGRAADRFGRRPALLVGLAGTILCTLLFGVADSFAVALLSRFLIGALNGNVALTKVYVGECADKATIAKAFSYLSFSWGIGVISAPALGGLLADPAEQFPETFGDSPFWKRFPYLLPNLIPAAWATFALAVGYWGLPETAVWQRRHAARVAASRGASSGVAAAEVGTENAPGDMSVELAQLQSGSGSIAGQGAEDESPLAEAVAISAASAPAAASRPRLRSGSSHAAGLPRSKAGASTQGPAASTMDATGSSRSGSRASAAAADAAEPRQPEPDDIQFSEGQGAGAHPVPRGVMRALSIASESEREAAAATELSVEDAVGLASSDTNGSSTASSKAASSAFASREAGSRNASRVDQTDAGVSEADSAALTRNDATARATAASRMTPRARASYASSALAASSGASPRAVTGSEPLGPPVPEGASLREVFADHAMRTSILAYGLLAVAQVQFDELVPVLLRLDPHLGGLGFSARETGAVQVVAGAAQIFGQIFILAPVTAKYGPIRCFLRTMLPLVALLLFPVVALFGESRGGTWALLALFLVAKTLLMQIAFTSIMIVINNSTRGFNLGLVTGLAQAVASGVRAVGPTVGGGVFSASLQWRGLGALRMHAAFVTVACCIVAGYWMGKRIPLWADSPPDYAAEAPASSPSTAAVGRAAQPGVYSDDASESNADSRIQGKGESSARAAAGRTTVASSKPPLPPAKTSSAREARVTSSSAPASKGASAAASGRQAPSALATRSHNHDDSNECFDDLNL